MSAPQAYEYLIDIFDSAYRRLYQLAVPPPGPDSGLAGSGLPEAAGHAVVTLGPATAGQKGRSQFCRTPELEPVTEFAFRGAAVTPGYQDVARLLEAGMEQTAGDDGAVEASGKEDAKKDPRQAEGEGEGERGGKAKGGVTFSVAPGALPEGAEAPSSAPSAAPAGASLVDALGATGARGSVFRDPAPLADEAEVEQLRESVRASIAETLKATRREGGGPRFAGDATALTPFALKAETGRTPRPLRETVRQGGGAGDEAPGDAFPTPQLLDTAPPRERGLEDREGQGDRSDLAEGGDHPDRRDPGTPQRSGLAKGVTFKEDLPTPPDGAPGSLAGLTTRGQLLRALGPLEPQESPIPARPVISVDVYSQAGQTPAPLAPAGQEGELAPEVPRTPTDRPLRRGDFSDGVRGSGLADRPAGGQEGQEGRERQDGSGSQSGSSGANSTGTNRSAQSGAMSSSMLRAEDLVRAKEATPYRRRESESGLEAGMENSPAQSEESDREGGK